MSLEVAAQGHAGVLGRLPAREDLVVAQQRRLLLEIENLQGADLSGSREKGAVTQQVQQRQTGAWQGDHH